MSTKQTTLKFRVRRKINEFEKENKIKKSNDFKGPANKHDRKEFKEEEFDLKRSESSPPKQKKNGSSESSPGTPSQSLGKLSIKESADESKNNLLHARQAFHTSYTSDLPGREDKLEELHKYLKEHLELRKSGSLYVSGPPGTGKTATISKAIQFAEFRIGYQMVYINCTSIKSSTSVYKHMAMELKLKISGKTEKNYINHIENHVISSKKMILLILDEIDQLDSKNQNVLYSIFEWSLLPSSKLVLIGIANALDLTDRILPRLQLYAKPSLLHFAPYTKEQIIKILTNRLKQWDVCDIFSANGIQLLAGKVAAISGDIRRALDIARRVVEIAENQKLPLHTSDQLNYSTSKDIDVKEVLSVLNGVYTSSRILDTESENSFPLQQKVVICALLLSLKRGKEKSITIGKLHEIYHQICVKRNIMSVDQAEFFSLCNLIETRGIFHIQKNKAARLSKISLQWDEDEVKSALEDQQMVADILSSHLK